MTRNLKIRLALREEGNFWNAYLALSDTMDGAKLIGSIVIESVRANPEVKARFQAVMQQVIASAVESMTGKEPERWEVTPAPESERSGHS
jgi:hypothetical protein